MVFTNTVIVSSRVLPPLEKLTPLNRETPPGCNILNPPPEFRHLNLGEIPISTVLFIIKTWLTYSLTHFFPKNTFSGCSFNPLMSSVTFLYPLKTSEKLRFSDVFRGYKTVALDINGLKR